MTAARAEGALREDVGAGDLVMFLAVLTRPLPSVSPELTGVVRERMLAALLDGLRPQGTAGLPGPSITGDRITADLTSGSS
ncbi:hypothetical protein OIE66_22610 [Nonomuraea sp. NBC_01738]|nr:hypothetical protein OIE66_22610 [Nonomuraea sp. NBC_01738]